MVTGYNQLYTHSHPRAVEVINSLPPLSLSTNLLPLPLLPPPHLTILDVHNPLVSLPHLDAGDGGPLLKARVEAFVCPLIWKGY